MALLSISDISGTIQKYFEKSWMDMPQEEFKTPLANSDLLEKATIPANSGQYAEFRRFYHMSPETNGTDDDPKTYSENAEPSSPIQLSGYVYQVAFEMLAAYTEIGNVAQATDPIDLVRKAKDEFQILIRRVIHRLTNSRCVKAITANVLNTSLVPSPLPSPFSTIYAGGVNSFGALTANSVFTMNDFKRARSLLRNLAGGVPGFKGDMYAAIIDEAVKDQLLEDPLFRDSAKRHEDMNQKAFGVGSLMTYEGMMWIIQSDPYRVQLPAAGGAISHRDDTGFVHVAHVIGKGALGYVDFGGAGTLTRRTLMPTFKVLDISKTGTGPSIGWRMPYQACVTDTNRGVNIAGCSRYNTAISDITGVSI